MEKTIIVYGGYGHTGKFIVSRLYEGGFKPVLSGRDSGKLALLGEQYPDLKTLTANIDDAPSLDTAFEKAGIIINGAGPYLETAEPIIRSALRLGKHYIDLSAEQNAVLDIFKTFSGPAGRSNTVILPAAAFYGGLGDLLSTVLTDGWREIDDITIYIGLDSWHPTQGTRLTGTKNHYQRVVLSSGQLQPLGGGEPFTWTFPAPIGEKEMIPVPMTEIVTISRHLPVQNIQTYISLNSIQDLRNENTPAPKPVDNKNRSAQQFCMEVVASKGNKRRRIMAQGRDIYAVTAPLVVEAVKRIHAGKVKKRGVTTMGEAFDAKDFLASLDGDDITISGVDER